MEARIFRAALLAATLIVCMGANYPTPNFIIRTHDPQLAERLGKEAEKLRRELAVAWLGQPMPDWSHPCPMTVRVGQQLGAGGATTFMFDRGEVFGWRMDIQGSTERLFDSVLPHEITHMIFASHFRQPLPRWADEGAASTVEHPSELMKHRRMLLFYLKNGGGIPFSRMVGMTEYPKRMMLLYAQGYSVADFLIQQGGRRKYVDFIGEALKTKQWSAALERHYEIPSLGTLQTTWLAWVQKGSPALEPARAPGGGTPVQVAAASGKQPPPERNLIYRHEKTAGEDPASRPNQPQQPGGRDKNTQDAASSPLVALADRGLTPAAPADGWHSTEEHSAPLRPAPAARRPLPEPSRTQSARPQPFEQPRQIILEWGSQ